MSTGQEPSPELCLSLEELALVFSLLGHAPLAKETLTNELGELNADELRGRILAAGNTLLAKGVFGANGGLVLEPAYEAVLGPMIHADFALQCSAFGAGVPERSLMFYVQGERIVRHSSYYGAYHELQALESAAAAVADIMAFFAPGLRFQAVPFALDPAQTQAARLLDGDTAGELQARLEAQGVDTTTAELFANDLRAHTQWSLTLRLWPSDEGVVTEIGYEIFAGAAGRAWLITVSGADDPAVHARPADEDALRELTHSLLRPVGP